MKCEAVCAFGHAPCTPCGRPLLAHRHMLVAHESSPETSSHLVACAAFKGFSVQTVQRFFWMFFLCPMVVVVAVVVEAVVQTDQTKAWLDARLPVWMRVQAPGSFGASQWALCCCCGCFFWVGPPGHWRGWSAAAEFVSHFVWLIVGRTYTNSLVCSAALLLQAFVF